MTDQLFDVPESLSPYAKWMRRNRIKVSYEPRWEDGGEYVAARTLRTGPNAAIHAYVNDFNAGPGCLRRKCEYAGDLFGFGNTEDEAIAKLCEIQGIPLYGADELNKREGHDDGKH